MIMKELDHGSVLAALPDRDPKGHKGDYGRLLLLCGSRGYTGAAALAAMGALRCGAGLVFLGVPESIYVIEAVKLTEPVVFPLPDQNGMFAEEAAEQVKARLERMDAVLIGPGLGKSDGTLMVLQCVLENFSGPVMVDADGINLVAQHKDLLRGRTGVTILTPHEGEAARLLGRPVSDRQTDALKLARELGAIVVLKGHETLITDGEQIFRNPTGNPGMAVGGSGDVLAGMIAGLLGQKLSALEAAACGCWLHGAAGDLCAREMGQYPMLPTDMLGVLPRLLK